MSTSAKFRPVFTLPELKLIQGELKNIPEQSEELSKILKYLNIFILKADCGAVNSQYVAGSSVLEKKRVALEEELAMYNTMKF